MLTTTADREISFLFKKIRYATNSQPINTEQEKKKVLADETYNPKLRYNKLKGNIPLIKKSLEKIKTDSSTMGKLLEERKEELITTCNFLLNRGTKKIALLSEQLYGIPSKELIKNAYKLVELKQTEEEKKHNTFTTTRKMIESLLRYRFEWKIKEREMIVGATFNSGTKTIYVNKNRKFSENDIRRLIVHEIGTHVARAENGKKQQYALFHIGFPGYLPTEEGLAMYHEQKAGLLSNALIKGYAGRVIAVHLSRTNSFSFVYNSLREFFDKEQSYILAIRAKRGLGDTSKPGAFTKDHVYLKGKYLIEEYIKEGGDIKKLYIGKIGVHHVPLLSKIEKCQ